MAPSKAKKEEKQGEKGKQKAPKIKRAMKVVSEDEEEEEKEKTPEALTSKDNRDIVIANLQEQVKLLMIEVSTLRKHVGKISPVAPETPGKKAGRSNSVAEAPPATPKGRRASTSSNKAKEKGCSCKGNCSNKICGCVKKDLHCLPTCKCSDACQNQDPDNQNEDKENEQDTPEIDIETASSSSSPDSSPDVQKNERPKSSKNASSRPVKEATNDKEYFNPMAPRRQLARSPSTSKITQDVQKSKPYHPALNEIPLPPPKYEPEEEELPPPEEINNAQVNWEEHKKQLVQCCKCKRSFFKHRLIKHENSCIQV